MLAHALLRSLLDQNVSHFSQAEQLCNAYGVTLEYQNLKLLTAPVSIRYEQLQWTMHELLNEWESNDFWFCWTRFEENCVILCNWSSGFTRLDEFISGGVNVRLGVQALASDTFFAPEEIAELAKIVAFYRNESDTAAAFAAQAEKLRARFGGSFEALALDRVIEVSSTALRAGMASGTSEAMLEPQVYGYILREHLYGTNLDLKRLTVQQLRPIALSYLKAKRCAHVLGTAATAVKLAEKYGADVHRAEVAGLLHDCTKKLSMPEQLALCEKYGIALDALEKKALKLLHAKTGAALARDVFGVDDEIYNAILWHTTGKPDMTVLEKVIYLADFIEPTRDFPGVDALRRTVWGDLDRGLLMGLEMTVEEMEEMGNPIHVNTLAARDYLKGKTNEGKAGSGQQL